MIFSAIMSSPEFAEVTTPCREYQGSINNQGYGVRHGLARTRFGTAFVHRQVMLMAGVDIAGKVVRHMCHNPRCFRVDHLAVGTQSDNMKDCVSAGRYRNQNTDKTHCPQGHEYTDANTYTYVRDGRPGTYRVCKACTRNRTNQRRTQPC